MVLQIVSVEYDNSMMALTLRGPVVPKVGDTLKSVDGVPVLTVEAIYDLPGGVRYVGPLHSVPTIGTLLELELNVCD